MYKTGLVIALVAASGCNWQQPLGAPANLAPDAPSGTYRGTLELDVRAFFGPLRLKRQTCTQPFELLVDTEEGVAGNVVCDFEEFGELDIWLLGEIRGMPEVGGDLDTPEFKGGWDGWFYNDEQVYGETVGEAMTPQGLRVEWFGYFDTEYVGPAPDLSPDDFF